MRRRRGRQRLRVHDHRFGYRHVQRAFRELAVERTVGHFERSARIKRSFRLECSIGLKRTLRHHDPDYGHRCDHVQE
jgi:hypothetical protein